MTARLLENVEKSYSVDADRVYGTGQSMGCMTVMYLAAQHPDLFAAELLVSGQWDVSDLAIPAEEKFLYFAAAGDENASGGQADVQGLLDEAGVDYGTTTLDATASSGDQEAAGTELVSDGDTANFATFTEGSVLEATGSDSGSGMGGSSEHMASFEPTARSPPPGTGCSPGPPAERPGRCPEPLRGTLAGRLLLCYSWNPHAARRRCVIVDENAVLGAGTLGPAPARGPVGTGAQELTVRQARGHS